MARGSKTLVLVHGAWHGSWCWQRVIPLLERRGFNVMAVDLPSTSAQPPSGAALSGDAAAVRGAIDAASGDVVVCGHSYGGMVISHPLVGTHPRVAHLIYLCAFVPDNGQSILPPGTGELAPWICIDERGMTLPDPSQAAPLFYGDCDPQTQQWAVRQLRAQSPACFAEPVSEPAWLSTPSTYIVCKQDQAMPEGLQRSVFATKAREVLELDASHSPFLSQPAALAELLATVAETNRGIESVRT